MNKSTAKKGPGRPRKNPGAATRKPPVPPVKTPVQPAATTPTETPPAASPPTPAAPPSAPSHSGNDEARKAELAALEAEATLRSQTQPSAAEQELQKQATQQQQQQLSQAEQERAEVAQLMTMFAHPTVQLLAPNWEANGLTKDALHKWAQGVTPMLLKYWPDMATNFPPELMAGFVTFGTFGPFFMSGIPARLPAVTPVENAGKTEAKA